MLIRKDRQLWWWKIETNNRNHQHIYPYSNMFLNSRYLSILAHNFQCHHNYYHLHKAVPNLLNLLFHCSTVLGLLHDSAIESEVGLVWLKTYLLSLLSLYLKQYRIVNPGDSKGLQLIDSSLGESQLSITFIKNLSFTLSIWWWFKNSQKF